MKKLLSGILVISMFMLGFCVLSYAHKGRTDAYGGHNCRATGTYHFHSGPLVGQEFSSKQEALQTLSGNKETLSNKKSDKITQTFVGSAKSNKYHYPSCQWARKISPANLVTFTGVKDAQSKGYIPCKVCKPPYK